MLYDGVQINDAQNGQIDLSKFNLYNISEISLHIPHAPELCLPARAFSGASVLNVKTIRPKLTAEKPFKILAGVKGGSFGLLNPYLQWQQRLSNEWSFIINTYKQEATGKYNFTSTNYGRDTSGARLNGDINARQIDGALYWAKSDSNRFHIQFNYYNIKRGLPGAVITDAQYLNQRLQNRDVFIQAGYEKIWNNTLHLLLNTKVADNYQRYTDKDFLNSIGGLDDSYTQKEFYQSAALSYKPVKLLEVSYSTDVAVTNLNSNAFAYAFPTRVSLFNNIAAKFEKLPLQKLIGLSATPKRVYDEEGSGKMEGFFHDNPPYTYSFTMERAITEGILCQYYYYPHVVELTPQEMVGYTEISAKLASLHNRAAKDAVAQKSYEMLLMERKRIIHKATGKLVVFESILKEVAASPSGLRYMLVYAPEGYYEEDENAAEFYPDVPDASRIIEYYANAVRQVSPTTHVAKYISESPDKDYVLSSFEEGKIDVLLSMKCLDEGVDIPRTEQAIFCSSTGNPRQFIQRRGRILRQHPDKKFARIHDLVVVPSSVPTGATFDLERNLVKKELERVVDFAYMAINKYEAIKAVESVCNRYDINPDTLNPYSTHD
ncbi:MAG: hypothetical protein EOP46_14470 [Sphingobacteriaceae bacterium]|nr:MAG: hypothetical protein EOP46_14470 [Sphingobacteriaceae bacterium]